ncbi:MAG: SMP-30/gluconolactonase/LRE family protein [Chloroflexota bacterium]
MDQERFDAALRALQAGTTRRRGLAGMLAVLLGTAGVPGREAAAKAKPGEPSAEGPCGDGSAKANRCTKDADCCTGYCADGQCRYKANWMSCKKNDECGSGRCVDRRCDGGCNPESSRCQENFNCCDGMICKNGTCKTSAAAKCTKQNCSGCCDGTTCRVGGSRVACGAKGAACTRCTIGVACENGSCGVVCSAQTCPDGCCKDGVCNKGTATNACGVGGAACEVCTGEMTCKSVGIYRACLGCLSDQDCPSAKPVCDTNTMICSQCMESSHCPDCQVCLSNVCAAPSWTALSTFGSGPGSATAKFNGPNGLALSSDGLEVYVSDALNFRIDLWTRPNTSSSTWTALTTFGSSSDFGLPDGVAISSDKLTAFVVGGTGNVVVFTRPGTTGSDATNWTLQTTIGSFSTAQPVPADQFNTPRNLFVTSDMLTIYVADSSAQRISVWSRPDITTNATAWTHQYNFGDTGTEPAKLAGAEDIHVSVDGLTAWIGESSRVSIWTRPDTTTDPSAWAYQTAFGEYGQDQGQFSGIGQIAVPSDGLTVLISDFSNNRVDIWTRPDATSTTWTAGTPFGSEGTSVCQFDGPAGVEISADGQRAYVSELNNNRISIWEK